MINIALFIPMAGFRPHPEHVNSVINAVNFLKNKRNDVLIHEYRCAVFPIQANRSACVGHALEGFGGRYKFDTTIWLDGDMKFPENVLQRMLLHDSPVVSGVYYLKKWPHHPLIFKRHRYDREKKMWVYLPILDKVLDIHPFYADMVGMGCVRVDIEVLKKIKPPYFQYRYHSDLEPRLKEMDFLKKYMVQGNTEEAHFWEKVRNKGYKILVDPLIQCEHETVKWIGQSDYALLYNAGKVKIAEDA